MFTFLIIIIIIVGYSVQKKDKKSEKQLAEDEECIAKLPNIFYKSHEMSSIEKALNVWPSKKELLEVFQYTSENRNIYLKMKNGRSISCPLSELDVMFEKVNTLYHITVKNGRTKFSFNVYAYVFTNEQWDIILNTLTLAGITRNVAIMGKAYKNMGKVNTVLKIIKAIS